MNITNPAIEALGTAKMLLLEPWGLTESDLDTAMSEIFEHQVDYADLYFQYTRSEGWSLEEGIVKAGSFSIEQGVGVRALSGEKTAFAYSDALNKEALLSSLMSYVALVGKVRLSGYVLMDKKVRQVHPISCIHNRIP